MRNILKRSKRMTLVAVVTTAALIFGTVGVGSAQAGLNPIDLGLAGEFVILSQTGITNVPTSTITGDIGTSPITGGAITGVDCAEVTGTIYTVDEAGPVCRVVDAARLGTAVLDMGAAYDDAAGRLDPDTINLGAGEIGGLTISPGLHNWDTGVSISDDVTLKGGPGDVWIFQIAGTLTQASDTSVVLIGGAQAGNIFWQVAGVVALGTGAHFEGTILAKTNITLTAGASVNGRLLAQTAVTLIQNTVTSVEANDGGNGGGNGGGNDVPEPFMGGRMTGGGSVFTADGVRVTHGFTLQCDASNKPNNLQINWGKGRDSQRFHLDDITNALCLDNPVIDPAPPSAGFDTYTGSGTGRLNNQSGATATWVFTDAGQPGVNDTATIRISDAGGTLVLEVSGVLSNGNHQAHNK